MTEPVKAEQEQIEVSRPGTGRFWVPKRELDYHISQGCSVVEKQTTGETPHNDVAETNEVPTDVDD